MSRVPDIGLTATEASRRLQFEGYNELPAAEKRSVFRIVWEVVRQPMFALLIAGGVVYLLLGDRMEAILLLAFASLSVSITIVQESRSEKVLEALRNLASPRALVIRAGKRIQIAGREVVRGDVIVIGEGDRVAADATLLKAHDLMLDESLLTGESVAVRKLAPAFDVPIDAAGAVAEGRIRRLSSQVRWSFAVAPMCWFTPPARAAKWGRSARIFVPSRLNSRICSGR